MVDCTRKVVTDRKWLGTASIVKVLPTRFADGWFLDVRKRISAQLLGL